MLFVKAANSGSQLYLLITSSFVDPQGTDYCLVVSISKHYTSLCAAQGPHFEVSPSAIGNQLSIPSGTVRTWKYKEAKFGKCFSLERTEVFAATRKYVTCIATVHLISNTQDG